MTKYILNTYICILTQSEWKSERDQMNSGSESESTQKWEWADYNNRSDKKILYTKTKYHQYSVGDDKSYS